MSIDAVFTISVIIFCIILFKKIDETYHIIDKMHI